LPVILTFHREFPFFRFFLLQLSAFDGSVALICRSRITGWFFKNAVVLGAIMPPAHKIDRRKPFIVFRSDHLTFADHVHQFNSGQDIACGAKDLNPIIVS